VQDSDQVLAPHTTLSLLLLVRNIN